MCVCSVACMRQAAPLVICGEYLERRSLSLFGNGVSGPAGEEWKRRACSSNIRQMDEEDHWLAMLAADVGKMGTPWALAARVRACRS